MPQAVSPQRRRLHPPDPAHCRGRRCRRLQCRGQAGAEAGAAHACAQQPGTAQVCTRRPRALRKAALPPSAVPKSGRCRSPRCARLRWTARHCTGPHAPVGAELGTAQVCMRRQSQVPGAELGTAKPGTPAWCRARGSALALCLHSRTRRLCIGSVWAPRFGTVSTRALGGTALAPFAVSLSALRCSAVRAVCTLPRVRQCARPAAGIDIPLKVSLGLEPASPASKSTS